MIKIEKVLLHDKKRLKHWSRIVLYFKGMYSLGIVETNLKTLESKINWLAVSHGHTPEETKLIHELGYKGDQSILNELTEQEKELIINTVKESEVLTKYTSKAAN